MLRANNLQQGLRTGFTAAQYLLRKYLLQIIVRNYLLAGFACGKSLQIVTLKVTYLSH